MNTIR
jgi:hypothetical protein